jgi:hypothetical protein
MYVLHHEVELQMLGMTQTGNKKKSYIYQQQIEDYKLN